MGDEVSNAQSKEGELQVKCGVKASREHARILSVEEQ